MKKHRFLKGVICGVLVTLLICGVLTGTTLYLYSNWVGDHAVTGGVETKLNNIKALIQSKYLFEDEIDTQKLEDGLIRGYVDALGDPYSVYYDKEESEELLSSLEGEFSGIGVLVSQDKNTNLITFVTVYEDSPAAKAGFQDGDVLYKVDGEDITAQDLDTVVAKMRGEKGTKVDITVVRQDNDKEITATVIRDTVEVQTVASKMLDGKIGYIQISQFDMVTESQFEKALTELQTQGAQGFIFDVRSNPGGSLDTVCKILDSILPEGTIVYTEDKNGKKETISSDDEHQLKLPMAVLVNGNSASASEIFSGAIQDYGVGTIVGTKTYGKGIVQQLFSLADGTYVKLTISEYFTPKGRTIHQKGVTPDVEIEYQASEDGTDNQLEKAIEVVKEKCEH